MVRVDVGRADRGAEQQEEPAQSESAFGRKTLTGRIPTHGYANTMDGMEDIVKVIG